jgi:hypothetical protein
MQLTKGIEAEDSVPDPFLFVFASLTMGILLYKDTGI